MPCHSYIRLHNLCKQHDQRGCGEEAIGGDHYGPVMVYMSKVEDAATADGSSGWFKVYEDSWASNPTGGDGGADFWGVKDMNNCCGLVNVPIPADIPAGDYLVRAEVIALHVASGAGGAQFYMSCYQITVSGGGSASPELVNFPGAYDASDPGILVNIHAPLETYIAPGPTVYAGGTTKSAGSDCEACEATCTAGTTVATALPNA